MTVASELAALQDATFAASPPATATSYPPERRMTGDELYAVLSSPRYAVVSTTRPDGRPHSAPSAFVLSGTAIWLPTVAGAVRLRNVRANPYAVVVVSDGVSDTHLAIIAEGPVTVIDAVPADVEADVVRQMGRVPEWVGAWIVLRASRLLSYAAEATGLATGAAEGQTV